MHGDEKGGVEWFVSTDGTDAGGNTIRVTEMTNYLETGSPAGKLIFHVFAALADLNAI
jgi:hypothetical protein